VARFPTYDEIEIVENYVYSVRLPSIADLRLRAGGAPLAIVVYAAEYRQAVQTVHQKHADMCYSRTGLARIGNSPPSYVPEARGCVSLSEKFGEVHAIPCRYAAYIAAQLIGDAQNFGPMHFLSSGGVGAENTPITPDSQRLFWVPRHKLFSGSECIRDRSLDLRFLTHHHNEKICRIHLYLQQNGFPTPYAGATLAQFPFVIPENVLLSSQQTSSSILISPQPHPLV
jgi:hypothetical protein